MAGGLMTMCESVQVVTMAASSTNSGVKGFVRREQRMHEQREALGALSRFACNSIESVGPFYDADQRLYDSIPVSQAVGDVDRLMKEFDPTILIIPAVSHHQDHRYTHEIGLACARPSREGRNLKAVLIGHYPFSDYYKMDTSRHSYFYVPMTEDVMYVKLRALEEYHSQLIHDEDIVSISNVSLIAATRGRECMHTYAERFEILRMIV